MNIKRRPVPEPAGEPEAAGDDLGASLPVLPGFREMALRRMADEQAARMAEDRGRLVRELAEQRQAFGLSHYLAESGVGLAQGIALAQRIATNSPSTNFAIINVLPRIAEQDRASGYVMESLTAAIAQGNDEAKKRIKDFLEKRAAKVKRT